MCNEKWDVIITDHTISRRTVSIMSLTTGYAIKFSKNK